MLHRFNHHARQCTSLLGKALVTRPFHFHSSEGSSMKLNLMRQSDLMKESRNLVPRRPTTDDIDFEWGELAWKEYLMKRNFLDRSEFDVASLREQESALLLYSNMLTYPLTMAQHWQDMGLDQRCKHKRLRLCIVGAEMECQLQGLWRELCSLVGSGVELELLGPMVDKYDWVDNSSWTKLDRLKMRVKQSKGTLQDIHEDLDSVDAFYCFHPGVGTTDRYSWFTAFDMICQSGKPCLLTAYNREDAEKDNDWWQCHFGEPLSYDLNRWRSLKDDSYNSFVTNNSYVAQVNARTTKQNREA